MRPRCVQIKLRTAPRCPGSPPAAMPDKRKQPDTAAAAAGGAAKVAGRGDIGADATPAATAPPSVSNAAVRRVKSMQLRSFVKENHGDETVGMQLCRIDPSHLNLCATVGGAYLSVFDTSHCGKHLAIMSQYYHPHPSDAKPLPAGSIVRPAVLTALAWLRPEVQPGDSAPAHAAVGTAAGQVVLVSVTANKAFAVLDVSSGGGGGGGGGGRKGGGKAAHAAVTTLLAFPSSPRLVLAGNLSAGSLALFDVRSAGAFGAPAPLSPVARFSAGGGVTCAVAHPTLPVFFTGHASGKVRRWELPAEAAGAAAQTSPAADAAVAAAPAPAPAAAAAVVGVGSSTVWERLFPTKGSHTVRALAFGRSDASGALDLFAKDQAGRVVQWRLEDGAAADPARTLVGSCVTKDAGGAALDVVATAGMLLVGTDSGEALAYQISDKGPPAKVRELAFNRIRGQVVGVQLSHDSRYVLVATGNGFLWRWEAQQSQGAGADGEEEDDEEDDGEEEEGGDGKGAEGPGGGDKADE